MIQQKGRIEYIDAMRGFTMLLVVMWHVYLFCMGGMETIHFSFHTICYEFRMPLFFFVSGFVFYSAKRCWNLEQTKSFFSKKIIVQLVTPSLFLLAFAYRCDLNFFDTFTREGKVGYWFTYMLFEFFVVYYLLFKLFELVRLNETTKDILFLAIGLLSYAATLPQVFDKLPIHVEIKNVLGLVYFKHLLFFVIGVLVKKRFADFEKLLDSRYFVLCCVFVFFSFNAFDWVFKSINVAGTQLMCSVTGLFLVFAFFRKKQATFSKETRIGRIMQMVGRRTLDIYLIHYFILPSHLNPTLGQFFANTNIQLLEFVLTAFISSIIIGTCLLISEVYRLSPWIEQNLFGVKK